MLKVRGAFFCVENFPVSGGAHRKMVLVGGEAEGELTIG